MKKHLHPNLLTKKYVRPATATIALGLALLVFSGAYYVATEYSTPLFFAETGATKKINPFLARAIPVQETTDYATAAGSYPQFPKASKEFNNAIKNTIRRGIMEHQIVSEENWKARAETDTQTPALPSADEKYTYVVDWNAVTQSEEIASVVIRHGGYSGGAHGSYAISTFTYDYRLQKIVTLPDLFLAHPNFLNKLSAFARTSLRTSLAEKMSGSLSDVDMDMLSAGTEPVLQNFAEFTLAPDNSYVTIYFGLYQVAAYVYGEQTLDVDLPTNDNIEPSWLE